MEKRPGAIKAKAEKDQVRGQTIEPYVSELCRVPVIHVEEDASQEAQPSGSMNQEISVPGTEGCPGPAGPDEKDGGHGEHFPEDEEGKEISCEDHAQRTACIDKAPHMLQVILHMKGVKKS